MDPKDEEKAYDKIERFAQERGLTHAAFIKNLVEQYEDIATMPLLRLGLTPIEVVWPKESWKHGEPFRGIFSDPGIQFYKSIAWIRTVDYIHGAGRPQWPDELKKRIASDETPPFTFKKMLLVSSDTLDKLEVWEWAFWWLHLKSEYPGKVEVFAVEQRHVEDWKKENWPTDKEFANLHELHDMGIYGKKAVGFLEIEPKKSEPGNYRWRLNPARGKEGEINGMPEAQALFEKVWNAANSMFDAFEGDSGKHIDIKKKLAEKLNLSAE